MPKLSEIIAKQRAERLGNVEKQKPIQSQSAELQKTTSEVISSDTAVERKASLRGSETGQIIGGNGSNRGQEKPAVLPKRLGVLDRLKADTTKIPAVGAPYTPGPRQAIAEIPNEPKIEKIESAAQTISKTENVVVQTMEIGTATETEKSEGNRSNGDTAVDRHDAKTNDGTVDVESLRKNLEYLALNIEQKELVGNVVRTIAMQLRSQPELIPYMKEADVDLVVRGLRRSYNVAVRVKTEKAEKKGKSTALDVELAGVMKDIGFKLGS